MFILCPNLVVSCTSLKKEYAEKFDLCNIDKPSSVQVTEEGWLTLEESHFAPED